MMNETPINLMLLVAFLLFYIFGASYGFYIMWFKFPETQKKIIKRNEQHIESKWSFVYFTHVWVQHWSFKWLARINTLLLLLFGGIGLLGIMYSLLRLLFNNLSLG